MTVPALAQDGQGGFRLPTPTPSPTPAPQGPVDIRDGVVIGPRTIPTERPQPQPQPQPRPTATATPTPVPSPIAALPRTTASPVPRTTASPVPPVQRPAQPASPPPVAVETPAPLETDILPDETPTQSVDPITTAPAAPAESIAAPEGAAENNWIMWATIAAVLALLAAGIVWLLRRRTSAGAPPRLMPAPALAEPVPLRRETAQLDEAPVTGLDAAPVAPSRVDLKLDIVSASRSFMMFNVEYRLNIANRSDRALRDIAVSAKLVCARSEQSAGTTAQPAASVERIGPQQSRTVTAQAQLPLAQVAPMRQGQKPLFIPLLVVTLEAADRPSEVHTFVVGAPSTAGATRLHPIALDTPPGGIAGLRAQEIKDAPALQTA